MRKIRFLLVFVVIVVFVLVFPETVEAAYISESGEYCYTSATLYYYDDDLVDGCECAQFSENYFQFIGDFSEEAKAFVIFSNIPYYGDALRGVWIKDNTLIVNIASTLSEPGGTAYETMILTLFLKNAEQFDADYLTLIDDSGNSYTKEGIITEKLPIRYMEGY